MWYVVMYSDLPVLRFGSQTLFHVCNGGAIVFFLFLTLSLLFTLLQMSHPTLSLIILLSLDTEFSFSLF